MRWNLGVGMQGAKKKIWILRGQGSDEFDKGVAGQTRGVELDRVEGRAINRGGQRL